MYSLAIPGWYASFSLI